MIGISTRWQRVDATFAAAAVASFLKSRGTDFSIRARGWRANVVDPNWDRLVEGGRPDFHPRAFDRKRASRAKAKHAFKMWVNKHDQILWTEPPAEEDLLYALRAGRRTILWTTWDSIKPDDEWSVNMMGDVIVPSEEQRRMLHQRWKLKHVEVVPWDPWLPVTRKDRVPPRGPVRLFMSIYGSQLQRVGLGSVVALARVLSTCPNAAATVACSKGLSAFTRREFAALQKTHPERLTFLFDCPWHEQFLAMSAHDLTLWPAMVDGLGVIGLTSFYMGTPVVGFDVPPVNEVLTAGVNAIVVPCKRDYDWMGVARATPDHRRFEHVVRELVKDPRRLADLASRTHKTLASNRDSFVTGLSKVLPD